MCITRDRNNPPPQIVRGPGSLTNLQLQGGGGIPAPPGFLSWPDFSILPTHTFGELARFLNSSYTHFSGRCHSGVAKCAEMVFQNPSFSSAKQRVFDLANSHQRKAIFVMVLGSLFATFREKALKTLHKRQCLYGFLNIFFRCWRMLFSHWKSDFCRSRKSATGLTEKPNAFGGVICPKYAPGLRKSS